MLRATRRHALAALAVCLFSLAGTAVAQTAYPSRPLRLIIPFAPGGANDISARILADELGRALGQPVVAENRPGAGGNIGAEAAARSAPDGHTLFWAQSATHGTNASLYKSLPFDPVKDFAGVSLIVQSPIAIGAHPSLPAANVAELIALAKKEPGKLFFGSGGNGTTPHMTGELFKMLAGVNLVHVPYKGSPAAILDLTAGRIPLHFDGVQALLPHVRSGAVKALGVSTRERVAVLPEVATIGETVPGFEAVSWFGVATNAGAPQAVIERLSAEINRLLKEPAVRERFTRLGMIVTGSTPAEMDAHVRSEIGKWRRVVEATGAKIE